MVTSAELHSYIFLFAHDSLALLLKLIGILSADKFELSVFYFLSYNERLDFSENLRAFLSRPGVRWLIRLQISYITFLKRAHLFHKNLNFNLFETM